MIGLMFFGAIALWGAIAIGLGLFLSKLFGQSWRGWAATALIPLIFFAPVADELIAYPQMKALCATLKPFEFVPGMNEKKAYGRTVYSEQRRSVESLSPSTVKVRRTSIVYVDAVTKEDLFQRSTAAPSSGMLGMPDGSSGGTMPMLLSSCKPVIESYDANGIPSRFAHLNLTKIPN